MPSKPLFGSPVAVGISDAVMAMRSVVSAVAEWDDRSAVNSATVQEALRMGMIYLRPTIGKSAFGIRRYEQISGQLAVTDRLHLEKAYTARRQAGGGGA